MSYHGVFVENHRDDEEMMSCQDGWHVEKGARVRTLLVGMRGDGRQNGTESGLSDWRRTGEDYHSLVQDCCGCVEMSCRMLSERASRRELGSGGSE